MTPVCLLGHSHLLFKGLQPFLMTQETCVEATRVLDRPRLTQTTRDRDAFRLTPDGSQHVDVSATVANSVYVKGEQEVWGGYASSTAP